MKTLLLTSPKRAVTQTEVDTLFPKKPSGWRFEIDHRKPSQSIDFKPDAIVVRVGDPSPKNKFKTWVHNLAHQQTAQAGDPYYIFVFPHHGQSNSLKTASRVASAVDVIQGSLKEFRKPDRVDVVVVDDSPGLAVKLNLIEAKLNIAPRSSPLDEVKQVMDATSDLRAESGNLSADAVAASFGVSMSQLAGWLNRTRQALSKTPDADSLQNDLVFFERVARLRAVLSKDRFQKWLRMANPQLDRKKPLDVLASGHRQVVADLVDDMLTGAPA